MGCTEQMMTVPGADGCDQLVDDGGDATLLIHKGKEFEEKYAKDGSLPDPNSTTNAEFKCILQLLKDSIPADKTKYTNGESLPRCQRGNDYGRAPLEGDGCEGRAPLPCHQRKRLRYEV